MATLEEDGWCLLSGEERHQEAPDEFEIPSRWDREGLSSGDAAQLLFDIEIRAHGRATERGVERMWVIVKSRTATGYTGVLDSEPVMAGDGSVLRRGDLVPFGPEHVIKIRTRPATQVVTQSDPKLLN